jgi:hypothetical protein
MNLDSLVQKQNVGDQITPEEATLYSAILREINTKGKESRFKKTDKGKFAVTAAAGK